MGIRIIEGRWEEVSKQVKLSGRKVRVVLEDDMDTVTVMKTDSPPLASKLEDQKKWLKQLHEYSNSHIQPTNDIDLNRDHIFEELTGDRG